MSDYSMAAFAHAGSAGGYGRQTGMLLRDYFAAAALTGLATHPNFVDSPDSITARAAYKMADAMIEERKHD